MTPTSSSTACSKPTRITKLSEYMASAARGETVVICSRNAPIAELRALARSDKRRRPVGLAQGQSWVPPRFFQPLPNRWFEQDAAGAAVLECVTV